MVLSYLPGLAPTMDRAFIHSRTEFAFPGGDIDLYTPFDDELPDMCLFYCTYSGDSREGSGWLWTLTS